MRIFLFLTLPLLFWGCSTVEVTKEFIKVTNTVTDQVKNSISKKETKLDKKIDTEEIYGGKEIDEEIEIIEEKKEKQKNIIQNQQKLAEINFIGKTESTIIDLLGKAKLNRVDGNVHTLRYDSNNCRIFLFFNQELNNKRVEFFELRNTKAELLNSKESLERCYREFDLIN